MHQYNHDTARPWMRFSRILLVFCVVITAFITWQMHDNRLLSVQTNSMAPALVRGDAIIITPTKLSRLKVGDVISYRSSVNPTVIITHRITYINMRQQILVTKGDGVMRTDSAISGSQVLGRDVCTIARLGYLLSFLRSKLGLAIATYIPASGVVIIELQRLYRFYGHSTYRLHSRCIKA